MSGLGKKPATERKLGFLLALLLLAFALRLFRLEEREIWYDEAFAVLYAEKEIGAIIYGTITPVEGAAADIHPLLYYLFLHGWTGLGQSPVIVRFPSVIFGLLSVCLIFRLGRELFTAKVGLLAAGLTVISPFHIWYSQEARMYGLLCLSSLLSICFFVRVWKEGKGVNWMSFAICTALSLYAHNLAFLILFTLDLFVLLRRRWELLKRLFIAHVAVGLLFLPWLLLVPGQLAKVRQAYWIPRPSLSELVRTLVVFNFNLPLPDWLLPLSLFFSLLLLFLTLYRTFRPSMASDEGNKWAAYLTMTLAFVPVMTMFLISQIRGVYIERGVLVCALVYYLTIAQTMLRGKLPRFVIASLIPVPLLLAGSLWYQYGYSQFPRSPFREATAYLRAHYQAGDVIIHDNKLSFFPSHYYDRDLFQEYIGDVPGSSTDTLALPTQEALGLLAQRDISHAVGEAERVWFVIFQRALDEAEELREPNANKAWLDSRYRLTGTQKYNDLNIFLYELS
jgi:mannosyltransferase